MYATLSLLMVQGVLGAFDTLWYHEWQQRLPSRPLAGRELLLHALRDFAYAVVFGSLAWLQWHGWLTWVLVGILLTEILITLSDFIEEDLHRPLPAGERVMHTVMGIVYGAFLACFVPELLSWSQRATGWSTANYGWLSWAMTAMAVGALGSGLRDLTASFRTPMK